MPALNKNSTKIRQHIDYTHVMSVRSEITDGEKVIVGKAIVFNQKTKLFAIEGKDYYEIIDGRALDTADLSDVFVKYNHNDGVMVVARSKVKEGPGSLKIDIQPDAAWVTIKPANTTAGNDMYELVRTEVLDKMSFGFTIEEESYNETEHTWTVRKIKKLYEVSAVPNPAYEATTLYARRAGEVESRLAEVESFRRKAEALYILSKK